MDKMIKIRNRASWMSKFWDIRANTRIVEKGIYKYVMLCNEMKSVFRTEFGNEPPNTASIYKLY
jgi:hypothetical protein